MDDRQRGETGTKSEESNCLFYSYIYMKYSISYEAMAIDQTGFILLNSSPSSLSMSPPGTVGNI